MLLGDVFGDLGLHLVRACHHTAVIAGVRGLLNVLALRSLIGGLLVHSREAILRYRVAVVSGGASASQTIRYASVSRHLAAVIIVTATAICTGGVSCL